MPREATIKDVLYGLEFTGAVLVRRSNGAKSSWSLFPGGLKVSQHVADAVRRDMRVRETAASLSEIRYGWRA